MRILIIQLFLISHSIFSQTIFKFEIKSGHNYNIYSDESLQLIIDKSDSTYAFTYLPNENGDLVTKIISEGKYVIDKKTITLFSENKEKYIPEMFGELTGLQFKIKSKKIIPISNQKYTSSDMFYFAKPLCKSLLFKEYPHLVYIKNSK